MYLFLLQNILQVYRDIKSLKFLEKSVGFKQGKGGSWKTCVTTRKDIPEEEVEKHLQTPGEEQPHIIGLVTNEKVNLLEIVGDGTIINVSEVDVPYAFILLTCSYYVFNLAYPRRFCQTLGFFQHKVLDEQYLDTKSSGFVNFLHKIEKHENKSVKK